MRKLTVALDIDDVLADLMVEWMRRYRNDYGHRLYPTDITDWDVSKFVRPDCGSKIYDYIRDGAIYSAVRPFLGAVDAVEGIRHDGHDVLFVSSCPEGTADAKMRWLIRNDFGTKKQIEHEFIAASQKHRINADVLVDDRLENVENYPGLSILVTRPHNELLKTTRKRVNGVEEVLETIYLLTGRLTAKDIASAKEKVA